EEINNYINEVKKSVESRTTKAEYERKSSEDASSRKPTYINGILLVNKKNGLPESFGGAEDPQARSAFEEMKKDAAKEGLYLNAFSTFRSYWTQDRLYWNYVSSFGQEPTDTFSARAGFSEHQTGLGFDIGGEDRSLWAEHGFKDTAEAQWLKNNCYKYGFILRYPEGKEWKTGFVYESWHFRYIGKEHSKNFDNNNLTLEEYLGV
ncbi:MAG: M15 family metallopeptidase, partial [Clostridium sp.]